MFGQKRIILHEHKLDRGTKFILVAIAIVLALHLFSPLVKVDKIMAEIGNIRMECTGVHPPPETLKNGGEIKLNCTGSLQ